MSRACIAKQTIKTETSGNEIMAMVRLTYSSYVDFVTPIFVFHAGNNEIRNRYFKKTFDKFYLQYKIEISKKIESDFEILI